MTNILDPLYDIIESVNKKNKSNLTIGVKKLKNNYNASDAETTINELEMMTGSKIGLSVKGDTIFFANENIGKQQKNYFPAKYYLNTAISEGVRAAQELESRIEVLTEEFEVAQTEFNVKQTVESQTKLQKIKNELDEKEEDYDIQLLKLNQYLGDENQRDIDKKLNDISLDIKIN